MRMKLVIGHLYPDMLNLYGDCGNVRCLEKRLVWRGIKAEIKPVLSGEEVDFSKFDIVVLGGGADREEKLACRYLKKYAREFKDYVEDGGVVLAVCGGYQLLGNYYKTCRDTIEGLGVLDIYTEWQEERLTGNIVLSSRLSGRPVVGFENHGGRTCIGNYASFGTVRRGYGNDGRSGEEGILYKNVLGTYLHGPLLPKNPEVCDHLLKAALWRKYGEEAKLPELADELEHEANRYAVELQGSRTCYF